MYTLAAMTARTPKPTSTSTTRTPPKKLVLDRFDTLQSDVAAFNRERNWRQFHSPKNLTMALAIEAAELMEPFRWDTTLGSWKKARTSPTAESVRDELADVVLLAMSMAHYLDIDLLAATRSKLERNRGRYPADRARGRSDKYTAYESNSAKTSRKTR